MQDFDSLVIGAGVVGIACARALAASGRAVLVLERNGAVGEETSSRNSEVLHAGNYYAPGSLKARHCVAGRSLAQAFAARAGVPHRLCGKLIVAVDDGEFETLAGLERKARANGVTNLEWLDAAGVASREPAVRAVGGLWSPSTGIIDSHAFMLALIGAAESDSALFVCRSEVTSLGREGAGFRVVVNGDEAAPVRVREVVVSAGLSSPQVLGQVEGVATPLVRPLRFAKGHYFRLAGASPFRHLVYPAPVPGGLGTHATIDLGGQARFGPDVAWIEALDYGFEEGRREAFYQSIRRWFPAITREALLPDYTGIRPKLVGPGEPDADFAIDGPDHHGVAGLVTLQGIESPGLTSALAIAGHVVALLDGGRPPIAGQNDFSP